MGFGVSKASSRELDGIGELFDGRILSEDFRFQIPFESCESRFIVSADSLGWDLSDGRYDALDIGGTHTL